MGRPYGSVRAPMLAILPKNGLLSASALQFAESGERDRAEREVLGRAALTVTNQYERLRVYAETLVLVQSESYIRRRAHDLSPFPISGRLMVIVMKNR